MGMREKDLAEKVKQCLKGAWSSATYPIAGDRYSAGSTAVELAIELFLKGGIDLVHRLRSELEHAEECQ